MSEPAVMEKTQIDEIVKVLTESEVDKIIDKMRKGAKVLRDGMAALFVGHAHKAKGYNSFAEFVTDYMGIKYSEGHLDWMRRHVLVEKNVGAIIADSDARALAKLSPEDQRAAYKEYKDGIKTGEVQDNGALQNIARRMAKAIEAPVSDGTPTVGRNGATKAVEATKGKKAVDAGVSESSPTETVSEPPIGILPLLFLSVGQSATHFYASASLPDGEIVQIAIPWAEAIRFIHSHEQAESEVYNASEVYSDAQDPDEESNPGDGFGGE